VDPNSSRNILFTLSKSLAEGQGWALESFRAIIQRATGSSERWSFVEEARDQETEAYTWRYQVQGLPDIDLVVDHILHELTDAVLLSEWHSVSEDRYIFGSLRRDRPERPAEQPTAEKTQTPQATETAS
jgi:hypothetical protein